MILQLLFSLLLSPAAAAPALDSLRVSGPAAETALPEPPQPREWTVMVYMNGRSNLEAIALDDLNRLEASLGTDKVAVVAEIGRPKGLEYDTDTDGDWVGVRRYLVRPDADKTRLASEMLADLGDSDMGDWKNAAAFLKWAREAYPAKRYMFVLWDHGWGWLDPAKAAFGEKSISHDFVTGNYFSTLDMPKIFKEAGRVDVYVSVACFMQMAEVAYELRDAAEVIVGSEEVIQLATINWEGFFGRFNAKPSATPEEAGAWLVDSFGEMYSRPDLQEQLAQTGFGAQLSAIRAAKMRALPALLKNWHTLASRAGDDAALARAKTEVLRFEVGDQTTDPEKLISFYGDLAHFVELAGRYSDKSRPGAAEAAAAGERLNAFLSSELVIRNSWVGRDRTGKEFSNARGLAINIPGKPGNLIDYLPTYDKLKFPRASGWDGFMKRLDGVGFR